MFARVLSLLLLFVIGAPSGAAAVTVREIVELTKAGLPDEVLTALIDADRTIFTLDADQILELRKAGVSEAVLVKMLRSRREFEERPAPVAPPVAEAAPQVVIIGAQPVQAPPVTVVVPYVVGFPIWGRPVHRGPARPFLGEEFRGFGRFINDGWVERK